MRFTSFIFGIVIVLTQIFSQNCLALSYPKNQIGQDVSWPNCHYLDFKPASFGIVGVTGGLSFIPNICINSEATLFRNNLSLYVNSGFPGEPYDLKFQTFPKNCLLSDIACLAYNYGYNSGLFATNYAYKQGIVANIWWIDVESDNSWTQSTQINLMSLMGEFNAIKLSTKATIIGFYSYPSVWSEIVGNWLNKLPLWEATDEASPLVAEQNCKQIGFTGQRPLITQFLNSSQTLDLDFSCS